MKSPEFLQTSSVLAKCHMPRTEGVIYSSYEISKEEVLCRYSNFNYQKYCKVMEDVGRCVYNCSCLKNIYICGKQEVSLKIIQMIEFSKTSFNDRVRKNIFLMLE